MKRIRNVAAAVWIMCTVLSVSAQTSRPSREQTENINLIVQRHTYLEECLQFNPKHQRVYVTEISYDDYEKGIVDYGDNAYLASGEQYSVWNGMISSVKSVYLYKNSTEEYPWLELYADGEKLQILHRHIDTIAQREEEPTAMLYKMEGGNIELTQYPGGVFAYEIIQKEGFREIYEVLTTGSYTSRTLIWQVIQDGDIVEFHDDDTYVRYENGILMEKGYGTTVYRYTTANGSGAYQKISADGEVKTVAMVERKTDEDGYLIYEKRAYSDGSAYEIYIGERVPDVSGLVNRGYPNFVPDRGELKTYW